MLSSILKKLSVIFILLSFPATQSIESYYASQTVVGKVLENTYICGIEVLRCSKWILWDSFFLISWSLGFLALKILAFKPILGLKYVCKRLTSDEDKINESIASLETESNILENLEVLGKSFILPLELLANIIFAMISLFVGIEYVSNHLAQPFYKKLYGLEWAKDYTAYDRKYYGALIYRRPAELKPLGVDAPLGPNPEEGREDQPDNP